MKVRDPPVAVSTEQLAIFDIWTRSCSPALMSFGIYLAGILLVVGGLVYGAVILHTPTPWIIVGALVLVGLGTLLAVKSTRQKDAPS